MGDGYSTEIIDLVEEGKALPPQLPGDEAVHILAMRSHPSEENGQAEDGEVFPLKLVADQQTFSWIKWELLICHGHICRAKVSSSTCMPYEAAHVMCRGEMHLLSDC